MGEDVSEVELVMHAYRLMRSGNYRRATEIKEAMKLDYPEVGADRIQQALQTLANKLVGASHDE